MQARVLLVGVLVAGGCVGIDAIDVVAEECNRYDTCDAYTAAYGDAVIVIECQQADFDRGCVALPELSIVLSDRDLVTPAQGGDTLAGS